jgi:tetratricopeptide (TPR) repeat protein
MIALQPDNILLKDSLMREYYAISQWASAYMISREILSADSENLIALEISCITLQNLGLKQQALNEYETLYLKTDRTDILYTISYLQFELKNFNESLTNLDILINNSLTEEMYVSVSNSDNSRQEILMRAQLHYLKGLIYSNQNNKDLARISFEKSVEISSDFQNAIDKLNLL